MPEDTDDFTIGVEEEYQIVDVATRELRPRIQHILPSAQVTAGDEVQAELYRSQIEIATPVCHSLADVRTELVRLRRTVIEAAERDGSRIAAAGTHPFSHWEDQQVTPKARYRWTALDYQQLARELIICGCHVHIGVRDQDAALGVVNRARVWLGPLLALSSNSPFWLGMDTGYASFRTNLWARFPMAGPPGVFASRDEYDALVAALVETGTIEDATRIYWDIRLPAHIETVEFRVADVLMTIDEAVMMAGLTRALARTCLDAERRGDGYSAARPELLRAAQWRAARYGVERDLIDVDAARTLPAGEIIDGFLSYLRPALEAANDWDEVSAAVRETIDRGTGARRQREAFRRDGRLEDVVDCIVAETARGTGMEQR